MKTVKVRIAVAVDENEDWYAFGSNRVSDGVKLSVVAGTFHESPEFHWFEGEVHVSNGTIPVIQAEVSNA